MVPGHLVCWPFGLFALAELKELAVDLICWPRHHRQGTEVFPDLKQQRPAEHATGHTMTWLTFELARNPDIQKKVQDCSVQTTGRGKLPSRHAVSEAKAVCPENALQEEVDQFFRCLNGRDPTYQEPSASLRVEIRLNVLLAGFEQVRCLGQMHH